MSEERVEEKSREIAETVERYAANRWRSWIPALILIPALIVWGIGFWAAAGLVRLLWDGVGPDLALTLGLLMLAVGSVGAGVVAYCVRRWVEHLGVSDSQVVPRSRHTCGVWESTRIATATTLLAWIAFPGVGALPERFQPLILAIALTAPIACSAAADR